MKALISRPQNGPISDPDETLHEPKKYLLSKGNGFLDEAFGNEREIVREPSVDPPSSGRTLVIPLARG